MDLFLICLSGFFILLGIAGSFLPVIPGPLTSWIGLLILSFISEVYISTDFLIISFSIALFIFLLDIFIPIVGAKKFGGGKGSTYGAADWSCHWDYSIFRSFWDSYLALFEALFLESSLSTKPIKKGALNAAFGSLIGFLIRRFSQVYCRACLWLLLPIRFVWSARGALLF